MASHRLFKHLIVSFVFLGVSFSLGAFLHDEDIANSWNLVKPRDPAMMRINPAVIGLRARSAAELEAGEGAFLGANETAQSRFGLVSDSRNFARGFDARAIDQINPQGIDYRLILPASLGPVSTGAEVASQIFDHSVSKFFEQEHIRNTSIGKAAKTVEENLKAEVAIGGQEPQSTQHNLKFQMKATQTKASMEYRGFTNADISYSVASQRTDIEIFEPLTNDSRLIYQHSNRPDETRDTVSLRLNF